MTRTTERKGEKSLGRKVLGKAPRGQRGRRHLGGQGKKVGGSAGRLKDVSVKGRKKIDQLQTGDVGGRGEEGGRRRKALKKRTQDKIKNELKGVGKKKKDRNGVTTGKKGVQAGKTLGERRTDD